MILKSFPALIIMSKQQSESVLTKSIEVIYIDHDKNSQFFPELMKKIKKQSPKAQKRRRARFESKTTIEQLFSVSDSEADRSCSGESFADSKSVSATKQRAHPKVDLPIRKHP